MRLLVLPFAAARGVLIRRALSRSHRHDEPAIQRDCGFGAVNFPTAGSDGQRTGLSDATVARGL
jgi:uncharacterized protein YebE (UPF0316 family)